MRGAVFCLPADSRLSSTRPRGRDFQSAPGSAGADLRYGVPYHASASPLERAPFFSQVVYGLALAALRGWPAARGFDLKCFLRTPGEYLF